MWRAVRLVEDPVGLRGGAVWPEVRCERVLGAELCLPRLSRGRRIARDEDDLRPRVAERLEVLLEVSRLVLADRCEGEGVEDEEDVRAAAEARRASRARRGATSRSNSGAASPVLTAIRLLLSLTGRPIVPPSAQLLREVREVEPERVVVRVDVALAVAARLRGARVPGRAEHRRRSRVPVLAHVPARLPDRDGGRVRLRRSREVDGRLREVELRLGEADVLERLRGRDRDDERVRVGVARRPRRRG